MKKIILAVVLLSPFATGLAPFAPQCRAQQEGGYNESVVVRGSYRPDIEPSEKLTFPAVVTDTMSRIEHAFTYSIAPTRLKALYEPTRLKAARIVGEPSTRLYNNYLRLGMGNYWSPLADLYWSSTRDRLKTYGIRVNHRSSWDKFAKLPEYGPVQQGNTGVTLFGKYIVGNTLQLSSDLGFEHDHNLYYGFTDSTLQATMNMPRDSVSLADYRASYNVATWNIGIKNMELDTRKLGYAANVHLGDLWGVWGQNEFNANINGDVHYGFNIKDQYKGIAYLHLEWDHYSNLTPDGSAMPLGYMGGASIPDTTAANILKVNPYVDFLFRGLQFRTGLTFAAWKIWGQQTPAPRFYPDVTVTKKLMKDRLVLSLAAVGGLDAVSLNSIRQVNPYVVPDFTPFVTSHYDFVFHTRWTFSRKLEANAEVSYSLLDGDPVFALSNAYALHNVYHVLPISDNRLTAGGDITFVNDEMITLRAGGHYYHYTYTGDGTVGDMVKYYRPDWDALVSAKVNYHDKWFLYLEGQLLGKMQADGGEELPMRYGINAEVEYRHNRALSFFLKMDNLAFQRYWLWANYPSQRGLFILGLTYTIPHK